MFKSVISYYSIDNALGYYRTSVMIIVARRRATIDRFSIVDPLEHQKSKLKVYKNIKSS